MANVEKVSVPLPVALDTDALRRLIREGMASGPSLDADEVFHRLKAKYAAVDQAET